MKWRIQAWLLTGALCIFAAPAGAAVHVEGDEVIFTLKAPEAKEVFIIGDFNQWNPTVEPMNLEGDHFEVRLFLVAGSTATSSSSTARQSMIRITRRGGNPRRVLMAAQPSYWLSVEMASC
jgi:hypothetical protein